MHLTPLESAIAAGAEGEGAAMAMRIVVDTGRLLGADCLVPVMSSHVDGCLFHGQSGTDFAELLVGRGARVRVPTTLNVGSLDMRRPANVRLEPGPRGLARRLMLAYEALGCAPSWTCAPYQAGHRPALGTDVAWGESNAVAFCNSVLGARTNRYGDFLDIACAIIGRAPHYGLHLPENRRAGLLLDTTALPERVRAAEAFYPVLGAWIGQNAGERIVVVEGLQGLATEDRLKALCAASASYGAVALLHVAGVTPEAPDATTILRPDADRARLSMADVDDIRTMLSTTGAEAIDAVAVGSPHLSHAEVDTIEHALAGRQLALPFYANTGRHVMARLEAEGRMDGLAAAGITFVVDTCIAVTPILPALDGGVLLTNSGKFACYVPGNTGYAVRYASLADCVESAVAGRLVLGDQPWT
jgi:predicted aconitase